MKERFKEYHRLTSDETTQLFSKSFIVLDTNVLLNFYRYSTSTVDRFIEVLTKIHEKLWLPYQVAKEFHRKRIDEIVMQRSIYAEAKKDITLLMQKFDDKNRNPFISDESLILFPALISELERGAERFDELLKEDSILQKIENLFLDKVGSDFNSIEYQELFKEGKERYKNKVPPGFADEKEKPEDLRKYGDLIIWKQMIRQSIEEAQSCIFITDDRKPDWWLTDKSKNIYMPLPELRNEFTTLTKYHFYAYQPFSFLEMINKELRMQIEPEVIKEVKELTHESKLDQQIETFIIKQNKNGDINNLGKSLTDLGYELSLVQSQDNIYQLSVFLPSIPDIKRIFLNEFRKLLDYYHLELIDIRS